MTAEEVKTKVCSKCGEEKDLDNFYKKRNQCKRCIGNYYRVYNEVNKDKLTAYRIKYEKDNKDKIREYRKIYREYNKDQTLDRRLKNSYKNMSLEKYNNLLLEQSEQCKICNRHKSVFTKNLFVDHCHKTGKVRGLLCHYCNSSLGLLREDISTLKSAIKYLEDFEKTLTQQYQYDTIDK